MISLTRNTYHIAEMARDRLPESLLIAGGPLPTLYPSRYASPFDGVFRGEVDLSFPRFCRDYIGQKATRSTLRDLPLEGYDGLFIPDPPAAVNNVSSRKWSERSCAPIGRPEPERPHGTEIPGMPARLHGIV